MGSSHVSFHGNDGSTTSYRYSGPVAKPDVIKSTFTSRNFSPLVMMRGDYFTCTTWSDYGFRFKNSPWSTMTQPTTSCMPPVHTTPSRRMAM